MSGPYRGRLAPSPTGYLHLGHAATFALAERRARESGGTLVLRIEDLDRGRCRPEFRAAIIEDLAWFGLHWQEGPDCGGPFTPYTQTERDYLHVWETLRAGGFIYPCTCSRRDVQSALNAPHAADDEPIYPGTCRPPAGTISDRLTPAGVNWRFRVPDGEKLAFTDLLQGLQEATCGVTFGDFIVWRKDNIPAYQLAVVADDAAMQISEVVRGADLLISTFRQLLLYRALGLTQPAFHHCLLITDESGQRLAKRHSALSLRELRASGLTPCEIRRRWRIMS